MARADSVPGVQDGGRDELPGLVREGIRDQITHLVDLKRKTLYGSGIIVLNGADGQAAVTEHFQKARISKIEWEASQ